MKITNIAQMTRIGLLVLVMSFMTTLPTSAQNSNNRNDNTTRTETPRVVERDNGTDWGWLGLLGLLGLAGLMPKKRQVQVQEFRDTQNNRSGAGTTQ